MDFALWSTIIGLLLIVMALSDSVLARLPLSTSMIYLVAGVLVSPLVFGLASITPLSRVALLERVAEVVVLLSLFTSGLKMSVGLRDGRWLLPVRLALLSMVVTVGLITALGVWMIGLPLGAAVLLGAVLAPTDPVLASEVQMAEPGDRDRLRFALTGEGGLNDGTAFPFVMLGLGLLGLHEIGPLGWRWFALDVVWATAWGIGVGAALGTVLGKFVLYLRRTHKEAVGLDNFLALGLIALAYGAAVLGNGYGFLAVFAAGVAFRRVEQQESSQALASPDAGGTGGNTPRRKQNGTIASPVQNAPAIALATRAVEALADPDVSHAREVATDPRHAAAFMAHAVLSFNEQIERIGEVAAVMIIGMLLWAIEWRHVQWWFVPLLLLIIRPVAVAVGLVGSQTSASQRALIGWFGIRGIGSLYYLMYSIGHGVDQELAAQLVALTLATVVVSISAHGVSVTPLMHLYERSKSRKVARRGR
jgi:sodium/hydrogen antiporter